LLLTLLEDPERFAITGKVVWINGRTTPGGRMMGVGIQFSGIEGANLQKKIESLMAGYTRADQSTNTM
jgi:type IV pilus assembly protein PilZ